MIKPFGINRAQQLCEAISDDGLPCYIAYASRLPATFLRERTYGFTSSGTLAEIIRPHIPAWRGPGHGMVLIDTEIRRKALERAEFWARYRDYGITPESMNNRQLWGTTLHELGHCWEHSAAAATEPASERVVSQNAKHLREWCEAGPPSDDFQFDAKLFQQHGLLWPFIRNVAHIAYRAQLAGVNAVPANVFDSERMSGFQPIRHFVDALGTEPRRLAGLPCHEIQTIDPPSAFTELHKRDVQSWFDSRRAVRDEPVLLTDEGA